MFSVPLRGDKANGIHRGMNFIRPVKDIEAMEIARCKYNSSVNFCCGVHGFIFQDARIFSHFSNDNEEFQ